MADDPSDVSMFPSLARNSARVHGGLGAVAESEPLLAGGWSWVPQDAGPHAMPIGYAVALETEPPLRDPATVNALTSVDVSTLEGL